MSAVKGVASAAVHRCRLPSRRAASLLAALLVLFAFAALQPTGGEGAAPSRHAVVLDDAATGSAAVAVRSVRQLPMHPPAPQLQPTLAVLAVPSAIVLLFVIGTPFWLQSRRSRQAYLLSSAGPGPPPLS